MSLISIITPTYNEVKNIKDLSLLIQSVCESNKINYEQIIIDNNSNDGTIEVIRDLTSKHKNIKAILNLSNYGHIRSPYYALLDSESDASIIMMSDFQSPPELIVDYYNKWKTGSKVVLGRRKIVSDNFFLKGLKSFYYNFLCKIANHKMERNITGEGLYDKSVINILKTIKDPYPYLRGLIFELGFQIDFVDFHQPLRKSGVSKNNLYTLLDLGLIGVVKHSNILLRFMIIFGFFSGFLSLLISIIFFFYKIFNWYSFQLGLAPIIVGFFGMASIQIMIIGLIGEYVSTVLTYSKNLPLVIEKERINFNEYNKK
jgi:glycosyltransferase involved in cell wall biosynthesis